jgi:chemosensory pili system protein ChpA (sensor histidine kinase/response regulator)
MNSPHTTGQPPGDDLSALAWVHGELRRSLENAHKSLRRHLKEAEAVGASDVDTVDPAVLRSARSQIHQGVGALELVGLPAVANVLRASEAAVQRMANKPAIVDMAAVETVERVSFAVLDFLGRHLAGKSVSPVMLFPQYRAALQVAAADRVHPADLWPLDFQWHELPAEPGVMPRASDAAALGSMEGLVLSLMRGSDREVLHVTSELCAGLAVGAETRHEGTLWQVAAGLFQAQERGLLVSDLYSKRVASRLLAQLRLAVKGQHEVSERLVQDLLFFCAHARPGAPRLDAVRAAWQLDGHPTADYDNARLGRFDPATVALARKRVAAAKDAWSAVAGGELHRVGSLAEPFTLVGDSLVKLLPGGEVLAQALQSAATQTTVSGQAPAAPLAMEVATSILYVDASIEDGEFDHPEMAPRVQRLAARIDAARSGAGNQALEPWMEELYRRVSDRQTMGSVVHELRATLSEVEKQIDQYFRNPAERQVLIPVPGQLSAMRGVLSVLGMDQAGQAVLHMRDDIDALAQTEVDPQRAIQAGTFDRVADNLGALSFLIDMLSVQPALAKSLFRFDPETGVLSAVMGQAERISAFAALDSEPGALSASEATRPLHEQAGAIAEAARGELPDAEIERRLERLAQQALTAEQPALARTANAASAALRGALDATQRQSVRQDLARALAGFAPQPPEVAPPAVPVPPPKATPAAAPGQTGLEDDAEMREIFIEEAREVVTDAGAALERLAETPENTGEMTTVRRAFHTLKGSSRMVGLKDFGEAAWACEQLYNARLAEAPRVDAPLRQFTQQALAYLGAWVEGIGAGRDDGHRSEAVVRSAEALRLHGRYEPLIAPVPTVPSASPAPEQAPEPPSVPAPEPLALTPAAPELAAAMESALGQAAPALASEGPVAVPAVPPAVPPAETPPSTSLEEMLSLLPPVPAPAPEPPTLELPTVTDELLALPPLAAAEPVAVPAPVPETGGPPATEPAGFDFDLDLDAGDATTTTLAERVPDLPAAADLELKLPEPATPMPVAVAEELSFDLDLSAFEPPAPPPPAADVDLALDMAEPASSVDLPLDPVTRSVPGAFDATMPLGLGDGLAGGSAAAPPAAEPAPAAAEPEPPLEEDEQVKVIGPLRISIPLFNIFLNEADELSRRLSTELAEWGMDALRHPVPESSSAFAHKLAGNSATVGYTDLSALARALEHALDRSLAVGRGRNGEVELFTEAAEEIRRLLHQFAAGFLRAVPADLMARLADHERWPVDLTEGPEAGEPAAPAGLGPAPALLATQPVALSDFAPLGDLSAAPSGARADAFDDDQDIDAVDAVDAELFPIFEEEAAELLPELQARLRQWHDHPSGRDAAAACMRVLHTFKGGARLAGAMRLGEMAHRLETAIEHLAALGTVGAGDIDPLQARSDAMALAFDALRRRQVLAALPAAEPPVVEPPVPDAPLPAATPAALAVPEVEIEPDLAPAAQAAQSVEAEAAALSPLVPPAPLSPLVAPVQPAAPEAVEPLAEPAAAARRAEPEHRIDWSRFASGDMPALPEERVPGAGAAAAVRVRAGLLDRLVNQAGEVSITRERIAADVKQLQGALVELTDSLERMRRQLRDIELQAETQISSRLELARAAGTNFDPLEMDRFTRFQELTRFMAESVNDVGTLQRSLQRTLQSAEDELASQARITRELQDDLLRTRMVEFESLADRLYRTVRQAAKETGKQVRLDIVGGAIEIDRGVLERMVGSFEHLLRNSVAHGVEPPAARAAAGKDPGGRIQVQVAQSGNEVAVEFADDGAGFDYERIRQRGIERGLLAADAAAGEAELAQLLFNPGFSTAEQVTELAGRGVGLDVVRSEVNAMGGRIETASARGQGTRFKLLLPLTTAVTQVVMLRCGTLQVAVPSTLIEIVRRVPGPDVERAYASGTIEHAGEPIPFFWLAALLQAGTRGGTEGRSQTVVVVRSALQRVAVHIDEVVGNQEVVVKNVGPQLSRLPGLAGVTLLPSGAVALIYNPVALATLYAGAARERMRQAAPQLPTPGAPPQVTEAAARTPLVLVVDDSLTVRRVTQRLLVREGYRVATAKDGLEALERLAEERPVVLLSDIEMPRMDGFDLVRNVRADERLADLPVVMITSRIAQKHRDYAAELGVDHYLGKPYSEEELLSLVARYAGADVHT